MLSRDKEHVKGLLDLVSSMADFVPVSISEMSCVIGVRMPLSKCSMINGAASRCFSGVAATIKDCDNSGKVKINWQSMVTSRKNYLYCFEE